MKTELEFEKCQGCLICVGPEYMEKQMYDVGIFHLCSSCYKKLTEDGFLDMDDTITGSRVLRLYPDGQTEARRNSFLLWG